MIESLLHLYEFLTNLPVLLSVLALFFVFGLPLHVFDRTERWFGNWIWGVLPAFATLLALMFLAYFAYQYTGIPIWIAPIAWLFGL